MDFFETAESRYSVRSYRPDAVEPEKLEKILAAAQTAPTACNLQPFRVFAINTRAHKEELSRVYGKPWFVQPPLVLAVCASRGKGWVRACDQKPYAQVDAAIAMDHIVLAATALGLGTCWIAAFNPEAASSFLNLTGDWEPIAFTPLGYTDGAAGEKRRKPRSELVVEI